jgi:E3 ubiquitin-protein ligase SHPRH
MYEARLFLVRKSNNDSVIDSVEEAQDLQRRKYELNHFFRNKNSNEGSEPGYDNNNPRSARENVQVCNTLLFLHIIQLNSCHLFILTFF